MNTGSDEKILALCGGVGGAKLAYGLTQILPPEELVIAVNTADDFVFHGLNISPDIDSVIYHLSKRNNPELGWGVQDDTWNFMDALEQVGVDSWFRLGDKDLVTHILRTELLGEGKSLTDATATIASTYGISHRILPMTDDPVHTKVETEQGWLDFQAYFVKEQCRPKVKGFRFAGIECAQVQVDLLRLLKGGGIGGIIICPSNPFVSIDPILSLPEMRSLLESRTFPVIAVSPIVNDKAIKGPAAKMLQELGAEVSSAAVLSFYQGLIDGYVVDKTDSDCNDVGDNDITVRSTQTVMKESEDKIALATFCCRFLKELRESA